MKVENNSCKVKACTTQVLAPGRYCLGFCFYIERTTQLPYSGIPFVLLIHKNYTNYQDRFLTGIGGPIRQGETSLQAMQREFEEKTSIQISNWYAFNFMRSPTWEVACFASMACKDSWNSITSLTDDEVIKFPVAEIFSRKDTLRDTDWLIPMGLASIQNWNFGRGHIDYKR